MKIIKMNALNGFKVMGLFQDNKEQEAQLELIKASLVNDDGTPIDLEVVNFSDVIGLLDEILEINGMGDESGN